MTSKYQQIFVILIIISIVGLISATTQAPERKCIPGKRYFDGCNNCYCTSKSTIFCTKTFCERMHTTTFKLIPMELLPPPPDFWQ
ncbi:serine protease inhibitor 3 [Mycetomoellerius zeteki]|uniref:serine protease inhibitor 3 n=1 Tax=Mycetomoellerius zeteki TaxID=64791 RepID=UPI00084E5403|nr:PREDICTED: serine protease inhibitor 3-like [Trachymyrmex zeteki]